MINILEAAANEKSVKRFVLTSSSCAALIPVPDKEGVRVDKSKLLDIYTESFNLTNCQILGTRPPSKRPGMSRHLPKTGDTTYMLHRKRYRSRRRGNG